MALEPGRLATLEPTRQLRGVLRLDQTAALFEALVAVFKRVGGRWTSVQMIMPVAAAFAVSAITFLLAMAVVELSAAEMITGASRLVAGTLQLLLLGFGIVGAAQVVGLPSADALVDIPTNQLGWWAPW